MVRPNKASERTRTWIKIAVEGNPGITVPNLVNKTGFDEKTVRMHLARLLDDRVISTETSTGITRCYVPSKEHRTPEARRVHAVLSEADLRAVYNAVFAEGTISRLVQERTGMSKHKVHRSLMALRSHGLAERRGKTLWCRTKNPWVEGMFSAETARADATNVAGRREISGSEA